MLKTFTDALAITDPPLDGALIGRVVEVKETRNVLLHNNLRVNRLYIERAGQSRRQCGDGSKLPLTREYVEEARLALDGLIQDLRARMIVKYGSFTRLAALRRLWDHLFSSPIMQFDDYWITDIEKDEITALKQGEREERISSSERAFLAVWRTHFNGWQTPSGAVSMYRLVGDTRRKMLWFLATLADFDVR